jgi:hypothetical protein
MDVLAAMFCAAERVDMLANLGAVGLRHWVLLYANDVLVFAKPERAKLLAVQGVLDCYKEASGLNVNFGKSSVAPIQCPEAEVDSVCDSLPCQVVSFPGMYLGMLLSIRKLRKSNMQPALNNLANKLSLWKARLMRRQGCVVYVQAVMTASVIYHLMLLDLDLWFLQAQWIS